MVEAKVDCIQLARQARFAAPAGTVRQKHFVACANMSRKKDGYATFVVEGRHLSVFENTK